MVATAGVEEVQVTFPLMSRVPPSLNKPIAVKRWLVCWAMVMFSSTIVIEERLAAFTFRPVAPVIEPSTALMVVSPRFLAVAVPAALMEAMVLLEELHVTWFEMLGIVPSE